ncbi:MAG: prepilin-type N-terminal cleavage/methylation domain-containing protein [Nitrospirae bacterium]|nr:prepilin-type N-terminal cleavage/methylation domain-containing protein [Nitrospirota bacterium]MCL5422807.1 prepilin-type N-terminal cleavage/methylation domain-containing protein [Nitrospirota bacterium]
MTTKRRKGDAATWRKGRMLNLRLPASPRPRISKNAGFTLLEVLVAVAITSIVIAALYSAFSLSRRAVDAVDDSLIRIQETRAVLDTMKREIESAVYRKDKPYTVFKVDDRDFYGKQASQMLFTSFSPLLPGLAKINYTVEENGETLVLKKKVSPAFGARGETKSTELVEDIESFTVEAGYGDRLVKTWDSGAAGSMPDEIRISMKVYTKKGESPLTISEIARPRCDKPL